MIKVTLKDHNAQAYEGEYSRATRYELSEGVFHLYEGSTKQVAAIPVGNVISIEVVSTNEVEHQVVINGSTAVNGSIEVNPAGRGRVITS